jgi:hypothetical protein
MMGASSGRGTSPTGWRPGLLLGMVLGWLFHGFVGTLFRVLIVIAILAPFVAAVIFWQRISGRNRVENKGRDAVVVHEGRRIRDAGTDRRSESSATPSGASGP